VVALGVLALAIIPVVLFPTATSRIVARVTVKLLFWKFRYIDGDQGTTRSTESKATDVLLRWESPFVPFELQRIRNKLEKAKMVYPSIDDIRITPVNISIKGRVPVPALWLTPPTFDEEKSNNTILYFHGGGFISGSMSTHTPFAAELARFANARALIIEYRLAPEHKLPAAVEDALTAYKWLVLEREVPSASIAFAGDSAGGALVLLTMLAINEERGLSYPGTAVAFSPWTDLSSDRPSFKKNAEKDLMISQEAALKCAELATGFSQPKQLKSPKFSAIYGKVEGFPPLLIQVGGAETLLNDSVDFVGKARVAGVDATLEVYEDMQHVFQFWFDWYPEAAAAIKKAGEYIKSHLR